MRKSILLGACLCCGLLASAQTSVVKDVEHQLKGSNPDNAAALKAIQPALTNAETSGIYTPWYLAGKAGFGIYDDMYKKEMIQGQISEAEKKQGGHAVMDAVGYYEKAINLPDEKGKTPNKKAKEMIKRLQEAHKDLYRAGFWLIQSQDYPGAYEAWEAYIKMPENTLLGKDAPVADHDSIVGQTNFYQSLASFYDRKYPQAVAKAREALKRGYTNVDLYRVGLQAATEARDTVALTEFAEGGNREFGSQEIGFIGTLINLQLAKNEYAKCHEYVDVALSQTPADSTNFRSQLITVQGAVYDQEGNREKAMECFNEAIKLDPNYARAYLLKGNSIYTAAQTADEASSSAMTPEVKNQFLEAAQLFQKAYEMSPDEMYQIPNVLYRLYYHLGQGYEADAEKWQNM
ncbi:MAG: tetratricopeptide repeat protein [Roseburia sp.]|nr:tetratricopeptide repeat protein [Roseburia sp.]